MAAEVKTNIAQEINLHGDPTINITRESDNSFIIKIFNKKGEVDIRNMKVFNSSLHDDFSGRKKIRESLKKIGIEDASSFLVNLKKVLKSYFPDILEFKFKSTKKSNKSTKKSNKTTKKSVNKSTKKSKKSKKTKKSL
jgi:hypothetical protein